jgi:xanthine dehydrogenase accessory factor
MTDLESGHQQILYPNEPEPDGTLPDLADAGRAALRDDACGTIEHGGRALFVQPYSPPLRFIIVGAVHIAQPLAVMASAAGWEVVIVDPRGAWATEDRFPGVRIVADWPDVALSALAPDRRTAIVTLTHDPKLDDPALTVALRSPAFYVGSLGSRKTHGARLRRLADAGLDDVQLARIHAPIGLAIGARTPSEIAVAILAQVMQVLRERRNVFSASAGSCPGVQAEPASG